MISKNFSKNKNDEENVEAFIKQNKTYEEYVAYVKENPECQKTLDVLGLDIRSEEDYRNHLSSEYFLSTQTNNNSDRGLYRLLEKQNKTNREMKELIRKQNRILEDILLRIERNT